VNHCCDPNLEARIHRDRVVFFSVRRIEAGDELTVDYKFSRKVGKIACRCGAAACRGTINVR
jgi:SET domain-containing protein